MTKSIRLTDIQLVLLASAASRDNGSLLPPPETLGDVPARIRKVVEQLIRRGLAAEAKLPVGVDAWRMDGERAIGVIITEAGRAAIHVDANDILATVEGSDGAESVPPPAPAADDTATPTLPPRNSKTAEVIALMRRPEGATLAELVDATGWLPHTTRAALTGLRKKGHAIERGSRGEASCYSLAAENAA